MLTIDNRNIGEDRPTYVIAEIGINYNGSYNIAEQLVTSAAECGVDAVKLQIITAEKSYTPDSISHSIFKKNELSPEEWQGLVKLARNLELTVFATFVNANDLKSAEPLELPAIKISSTNITNFPLLKAIARLGKPVILSTGMGYLSEVDEAVRYLEERGLRKLGILHCSSLYPAAPENLNLRAIQTLKMAYPEYPIGFSDHTMGIHCTVAAVVCGAAIIEKHFSLDRDMDGPDHHFSATPQELKTLVAALREVEAALGSTRKHPVSGELQLRKQFQRSLVAAVDIKQGQRLESEMLIPKRSPNKGIAPKHLDIVCGRRVRSNVSKDSPLTWDHI
ncbi:MAG: N-acetylneuraminate synthase family protein [Nitrospinaceae bacterium]|nr:N-acetylneuraminate synthase family protein [Nitrospinaceae bacterium]